MATKKFVLGGVLCAAAIGFSSSSQAYHPSIYQPVQAIEYNRPYHAHISREVHYAPWVFSRGYIVVRNRSHHERRQRYYHRVHW